MKHKYHLVVWSNLTFLLNFQWITFPTQSSLVSYCFFFNLLHLLIMKLIVLCFSPHNLHFLFHCVLSFFDLTLLILVVLFCITIWRDSVSLIKFHFFSRVLVLCEISSVCSLKYPCSCFSCHFYFLVIFVILIIILSVLFLLPVTSLSLLFFYVVS